MGKDTITVIIPVYRVERYLEKCVDSVLGQTYRDLEIILVDDGSPDGCGGICDRYAAVDSRVKVIHKPNGGLSSARNAGLDAAHGRYIGFVDSDDYIDPAMYEKLLAALERTGADMSLCDVIYVDEQGQRAAEIPPLPQEVLRPEQAYQRVELARDGWRYVTAWNRLYRREIFDGLRFREGKIHEDELAVVPVYERCAAVAVISDVLYWDVCRPGSIMTGSAAMRRLDAVDAYLDRWAHYRDRGWPKLARAAAEKAYALVWSVMDKVDVAAQRETLGPVVRRVARAQTACGDMRGARLWLRYLRRRGEGRET